VGKSRFKYLKPEDIRNLSSYEFAPKQLVDGYLAGRHQSRRRGASTEFRDYRPYVSGDYLGDLDWKVFARTERYYVRTFEKETDTACYIMLDCSASMGFGTRITKLEYSSFFAAALCHLVTKSGNLVALELFDAAVRQYLPLGGGSTHVNNLMHVLESNTPGGKTSIVSALKKSFPLFKRKGTLIVISDFFDDPGAIFAALSQYLHEGFKVSLFHVLAPEELELAPNGLSLFVDLEDGSKIPVHAASVEKRYKALVERHIESLRGLSTRGTVDYMLARTDVHYFKLFDKLVKRKSTYK